MFSLSIVRRYRTKAASIERIKCLNKNFKPHMLHNYNIYSRTQCTTAPLQEKRIARLNQWKPLYANWCLDYVYVGQKDPVLWNCVWKGWLTINTTLVMEPTSLVSRRRANTACSTISAAVKCLFKPILKNMLIFKIHAACLGH